MTEPQYFDPYTRIEAAICGRLKAGLGAMVRDVTSYGGELDDDLGQIVRALPAAWVTFGGITGTKPYSTSKEKWVATGRFAVMAGQSNARSEEAMRRGGHRPQEIGTNPLVWAIRRLLIQQDLTDQDATLEISALRPGRVRTLFNTQLRGDAVSVFACEFETDWIEDALVNGRFPTAPAEGAEERYDALFARYTGSRSPADPDLTRVDLNYHLTPIKPTPDATDSVLFDKED